MSRVKEHSAPEIGQKTPKGPSYVVGLKWMTGEFFKKVAGCSENDYKEDDTGQIPLPGSSFEGPVKSTI